MIQQEAASQGGEHSLSPKSKGQRAHIRFTTSNMIDSLRPTVNTSTSTIKPPASPRGNAANRRLSQTRSNPTLSQQQFQQQRSRPTSQVFNSQQTVGPTQDFLQKSSQSVEEQEGRRTSLTSTSRRRSGRRGSPPGTQQQDKGSLKSIPPQPVTQDWPLEIHSTRDDDSGSEENEEEPPLQAITTRHSSQITTRYYTQSLSPSPRRSLSPSATQLSQPDEVDKHAASTDQRQHQPSSADSLGLSEIVCGQRMPTFSPTPNARPSTQTQPYDDIDEVEYQDDLPELYDDVNNIGRTTVAEDSLVGTSGEALSYSTTQTRGVDVNSVDAREERSHNDQDDIIPSTFLGRMPKSGSHPDVEEESEQEPVEEELLERHMGSISPEVESEDNDDTRNRKQVPSSPSTLSQKSATSRHNIFQTSHDIAKTGRMKTYGKQGRGRERPSLPDHVKRQLDKDTLDLVSQTPSVQQVFLCIEIPSVPESTESQSKVAMNAKSKALRSKPNAERKRVSEGSSKKEPKSPSPPPPPPQRAVRRPTDRKRNQTDTQRRSSRRAAPRHPGVHYEKEISDYDDNIEEDERKSEDKSNSDELEVAGVSPSSILRPIRTHLLPPKKRIRAQETFQNDSLSSSQEQQRRPGPRVLHDSDSDGEQVLHNVRKRRNNGNRLSSTGPSPPTEEQEQEYEQEQEQDQDVQQSPSPPSPRPDEEYDSSRPQSDSAERRDGEDQEQGLDRRWEVTKLQKVWKEHGIRWPLRQGQGEEEYNAYFVFGSALPLPK